MIPSLWDTSGVFNKESQNNYLFSAFIDKSLLFTDFFFYSESNILFLFTNIDGYGEAGT